MKKHLSYWIEKAFGVKIKKSMAEQITTVRAILDQLNNGAGRDTPWVPLLGVNFLSFAQVNPPSEINVTNNGLVLKAFINTNTGEVKTFLAKWTDAPETNQLP